MLYFTRRHRKSVNEIHGNVYENVDKKAHGAYDRDLRMSISRAETGYREKDLEIAIALGAGFSSKEEAAQAAGVDRSTIYSRLATNKDFIERWAAFTRSVLAQRIAAASEKLKAKYERMYEKAVDVVDETLDDREDPRLRFQAATRVIDEVKGRPVQRVETTLESTHTERHEIVGLPADVLRSLVGAIRGGQALLTGGPVEEAEVIEVEPIPTDVE